jgi:hypothetical protein
MTDSKAKKQPKRNNVSGSKRAPAKGKKMSGAGPSPDLIRERAFELYEGRGKEHGADEKDWLRAEEEILGRQSAASSL